MPRLMFLSQQSLPRKGLRSPGCGCWLEEEKTCFEGKRTLTHVKELSIVHTGRNNSFSFENSSKNNLQKYGLPCEVNGSKIAKTTDQCWLIVTERTWEISSFKTWTILCLYDFVTCTCTGMSKKILLRSLRCMLNADSSGTELYLN